MLPVASRSSNSLLSVSGSGFLVLFDNFFVCLVPPKIALGRLHKYDWDATSSAVASPHPIVVPDLTLLLSVPDEERVRRAARRVGMPRLFYDPTFTRYFTEHFERPLVARLVRIRADREAAVVTDRAATVIGGYHRAHTGAAA